MKPLILVAEDNLDLLFNLQLLLEDNNFEVITTKSGKEALETLEQLSRVPDLIISDIKMPDINGHDFFITVSDDPRWSSVPFIFLTALDSPEDIRFGKMLGADDYLTKPFDKEDLLAIVAGKISRRKKTESIIKDVERSLPLLKSVPRLTQAQKEEIILINVEWDDIVGPKLAASFPKNQTLSFSLLEVGTQLFQSTVAIYGNENISQAEGILIRIDNIRRHGYLYFDSYPEPASRSGEHKFMLGVIAPNITYANSLEIKRVFIEISTAIKVKKSWDIESYWGKITNILVSKPKD